MKKIILSCYFIICTLLCQIGCSQSEIDVNGDVFIVTKGSQNIKLGLVEINIFSESVIQPFAKSKFDIAKAAILESKQVKIKLHDILDARPIKNQAKYDSAFAEWKIARRAESKYKTGEFFVSDLPTPLLQTKTDADGKFTFKLKPGKYALVAYASRMVGDETETYYWLNWITVNQKQQNRIMLSNDNKFENGIPESFIPYDFDLWCSFMY